MQFDKIKPSELKKGDIVLSVDLDNHESLDEIMCIDMGCIWTKGISDSLECKETINELLTEYKAIYLIRR